MDSIHEKFTRVREEEYTEIHPVDEMESSVSKNLRQLTGNDDSERFVSIQFYDDPLCGDL